LLAPWDGVRARGGNAAVELPAEREKTLPKVEKFPMTKSAVVAFAANQRAHEDRPVDSLHGVSAHWAFHYTAAFVGRRFGIHHVRTCIQLFSIAAANARYSSEFPSFCASAMRLPCSGVGTRVFRGKRRGDGGIGSVSQSSLAPNGHYLSTGNVP
jgi:hypothetical protein